MPRKRIQISNSGLPIDDTVDNGVDEQAPVYPAPTFITPLEEEGTVIGDIQRFDMVDRTALEEKARELVAPLRVLLTQAEETVTRVETLLAPEMAWLRGLDRVNWVGVAARYASLTTLALPGIHDVMTTLPVVLGAVETYREQVKMWRGATHKVRQAVHIDHPHTVTTEVRRIRKGLENIVTSVEPAVKGALDILKEKVARIHKLIVSVGPAMGGAGAELRRPAPEDTRPQYYKDFTPRR